MSVLSNTGDGALQVPGFGSIPLNYEPHPSLRFAGGLVEYRHTPRLTRREMAMLRVMQRITEKPGWDQALLSPDEIQLAEWLKEAQATETFLISPVTWDWCIAELRDKARVWQENNRLLVFDSSSAVCQAKILPLPLSDIQREVARLGKQTSQDSPLVDPSEFCLVYDRSSVLVNGGRVPLDNPWQLTGEIAAELPAHPAYNYKAIAGTCIMSGRSYPKSCWSNRFQWLPCEVEFASSTLTNGTPTVRITSYINNLHPQDQRPLYAHLEHLIACSIPSWNEILFYGETRGRNPPRILTYGCHIENYQEKHPLFELLCPMLNWQTLVETEQEWKEVCDQVREYVSGPEPPLHKQANPQKDFPASLLDKLTPDQWEDPRKVNGIARIKRQRRAWFEYPEPGVSFSYEQWKQGRFTGQAIVPQRIGQFPDPLHHDHIPVRLEDKFRLDGLQVVVEISRIDLTPENPTYSGETHFHTEGLRNEHIVATTVYVVEADNVTQCRVSFQHEDKVHATELECIEPYALSEVLDLESWVIGEETLPRGVHTFGSVPVVEGNLLSWPNTFRSKQDEFGLVNPHQPGHIIIIKLRLVDPHYRICSTRNVPPQQHDWWAAAVRDATNIDSHLPPELVGLVMEQTGWWPMSTPEARSLREELRDDQKRARETAEEREVITLRH